MSAETTSRPQRIVVTGASGFVGVPTCRLLAEAGHRVVAAGRSPPQGLGALSIEFRQVHDFADPSACDTALAGADAVVHLAGRAHVGARDPNAAALYHRGNVEVTECLAEAAVRHAIKRFVMISSIKVNGEATTDRPFRASDPPAPEDDYGRTKLLAEQGLQRIAGDRMQWVIIRPPMMYGPGVKGNFLRLMRIARAGLPVPFASIRNRRDLLYVGSLADLILCVLDHPAAANRIFLACDGAPVSTPQLHTAITRGLGMPARIWPCPPSLLAAASRLAPGSGTLRRLVGNLEIDASDTRTILGWSSSVDFTKSIALTTHWFEHHRPNAQAAHQF